jgi:hypothetical protein
MRRRVRVCYVTKFERYWNSGHWSARRPGDKKRKGCACVIWTFNGFRSAGPSIRIASRLRRLEGVASNEPTGTKQKFAE